MLTEMETTGFIRMGLQDKDIMDHFVHHHNLTTTAEHSILTTG